MSKQAITFNKKHPSDATRSRRRRNQKRRQQSARQQRWQDGVQMIRYVLSNILSHEEDAQIRSEFEAICRRNDRRIKSKQTDEQIILKAIRSGCWTVEDIQDETGFTRPFIRELVKELWQDRKITVGDNLYKPIDE